MNKQWIYVGICCIFLHQVYSFDQQDFSDERQQAASPSGEYIPNAKEKERSLRYFDKQIQRRNEKRNQSATGSLDQKEKMMENLQREQKAKREQEEIKLEQKRQEEKREERIRQEWRRQEILRQEEARRNAR